MKILGLFRHAKSDWDDLAKRDFDRGLNDRGRRGAVLMGEHIRNHGIKWDVLVASPAERVKQTLEAGLPDIEPVFDQRIYLASADTILETVMDKAGDAKAVMVAGHNPGLQEVLFELVPHANENALFFEAARKFPTASYAVLELDIDDWSELASGCGTLVYFARPRDLDPELGPED
ncbi:SixA phosphatase family protein [Altererythrobacter litoralis]|uniref:Histidine phosphatase family protein n=1 Tax=Altererythrobacter litoralis TaxID=3113904 RepID=A0ABU7GER3_9SPHN|nr:histidine phosphatase family protein [Erythrobacteraceae bacterium 1XM1-14]